MALHLNPGSLGGLIAFLVWPPHYRDKAEAPGDSMLPKVTQGQRVQNPTLSQPLPAAQPPPGEPQPQRCACPATAGGPCTEPQPCRQPPATPARTLSPSSKLRAASSHPVSISLGLQRKQRPPAGRNSLHFQHQPWPRASPAGLSALLSCFPPEPVSGRALDLPASHGPST